MLKAEYFFSVSESFLEKKASGDQDLSRSCCCWTAPMCESEASTAREVGALHWGWTNSRTNERSHEWSPANGLPGTLESICEGSKDLGCTMEKLTVENDHSKKPLEARLVCWLWKGGNGSRVLYQGSTTWDWETVAKEVNFFNNKLALGQANSKTILSTEEKYILERMDVRG